MVKNFLWLMDLGLAIPAAYFLWRDSVSAGKRSASVTRSFLCPVIYTFFVFSVRSLARWLIVSRKQNRFYMGMLFQIAAANAAENKMEYLIILFALPFIFYALNRIQTKKFRKHKVKTIPVQYYDEDRSGPGLRIRQGTARINAEDHLFVNGAVQRTAPIGMQEKYYVQIRCCLVNKDGDIIFNAGDPHLKDLSKNNFDTFSITVYRISRFFDPAEIDKICLYCMVTENSNPRNR